MIPTILVVFAILRKPDFFCSVPFSDHLDPLSRHLHLCHLASLFAEEVGFTVKSSC